MIKTAAYIRVSTQEQKMHGISLDAQRDKLTEYAKAHSLEIVDWYEDEGISGRKLIKNRPALQKMIQDAEKGAFEHIIFIKLDRFFRSVAEYHECMKRLDSVTWTATEEKYDLTTANGRAFVNMKLTIAELEADQTSERIKLVNEYKVKTGQPTTGSVPWSHKIISTDTGKRIVIDAAKREQCIDVINYFLRTQSLRKTLEYSKQYHSFYDIQGLKRWLMSSLLVGQYRDNPNYCEPLIDIETFEELQQKCKRNVREKSKTPPIFSQLLVCPECGRKLSGVAWSHRAQNGKRYTYKRYRCNVNAKGQGCDNGKVLTEAPVERALLDALEEYVSNYSEYEFEGKEQANHREAEKLKSQLDRLNIMFERGRIPLNEYDKKYSEVSEEIKRLEGRKSTDNREIIDRLNNIIKTGWREAYKALDREHRRDFWHTVLMSATIEKNGHEYTVIDLVFNRVDPLGRT